MGDEPPPHAATRVIASLTRSIVPRRWPASQVLILTDDLIGRSGRELASAHADRYLVACVQKLIGP
jgi:hypothetical protein